ncbi:MAG: glycosyltransferase [Cytophagaceae bacterium]|nr:MAG: glycosyltransferase [Cytophagaceae bacterium]
MKIAFVIHCFFPDHFYGTETYTLGLAKHYIAAGHEVTVVSAIFQGEPAADALVTRYEYEGVPVIAIDKNKRPHTRVKETYYQPEMRAVLREVLLEAKPDIVHVTHLINHTAVLLEVTQELGIPTYATFTDFFGFCLNNKLEASDGKLCAGPSRTRTNCVACYIKDASRNPYSEPWIRRAQTARSAKWIAATANFGRRLPGLKGGPVDGLIEDIAQRPNTLVGLYNSAYRGAVAPTKFLSSAYRDNGVTSPMREIWFGVDIDRSPKPARAPHHRPVIGYIGQIAPHKGTDLLIEAFQRLPENSAELLIYGPADQDPAYMETLKHLAQNDAISFMGTFPSQEMAQILKRMDLLVIPSRWYENSPLVLLNALATHTPVVVSDVAGMTEFLEPGVNGFSFKRGSADDLAKCLTGLVAEPKALYGLAKTTSYTRTTDVMAAETLSMYQ